MLTERLAELGVTIERGVELVGFEQDADEVRSTVRDSDGRERTIVSSWIAGTDGSHSTVRDLVGTKLEGSFKGERFLLGDVEADYDLDRTSMHYVLLGRCRPAAGVPDGGRSAAPDRPDRSRRRRPSRRSRRMQAIADQRAHGIVLRSSHWITIFEIHHAQVPAYRFGRAFLAGDAAHVHSPAGGQGMNTGMQDAFNLGWKLAVAARGEAAPGLLESYNAERHPVAARVITQTTRMTNLGTLHHELERKLRNFVIHTAIGFGPDPITPGRRDRGGRRRLSRQPDRGDRARRPRRPAARRCGTRRRRGSSPHSTRCSRGPPATRRCTSPERHVVPAPIELQGAGVRHVLVGPGSDNAAFDQVVFDPDRLIANRYEIGVRGELVMVRPDGYIGLRTGIDDQTGVESYLAGNRGAARAG